MAQSADHLVDQIAQLNAARNLVLGDAAFYPQIVNGVLPIIGPRARVELRRWGAEFLAETFASPAFNSGPKRQLATSVLPTLREILELPERDTATLKYIVQTAASLYPLVFRHIINHPDDAAVWENMTAMKQDILRRWDSFPYPVKICCIKFVQRVVQVQTHGLIADPRRPDQNETSLAIVPRNHAVLTLPNLEAEASGLLDRLLSVFQEESRNPSHPLAGKMQQYIDRLMQSRIEAVDDSSRKRGLPSEPTDGLDSAKRARLGAEAPRSLYIPPMPPGRITWAQLYTLTEDPAVQNFDVRSSMPADFVARILPSIISRVDQSLLQQAVDAVRMRNQVALQRHAARTITAPAEDEDDDYEPEYQPMDVSEPMAAPAHTAAAGLADAEPDLVSLGPFVLPQPPPLKEEEAAEIGRGAVSRVFGMLATTEVAPASAKGKVQQHLGFARLAGSTFDRDAWVTVLTRLATRAPAGLEADGKKAADEASRKPAIADSIRETLYRYILEDFRGRVNVGIMWLNEEWYNDRVQMTFVATHRSDDDDEEPSVPLHYDHWALKLLDGFLPYLDSRDMKIFIRFLSEIPEVTIPITKRVASLAKDPERVNLCVQSLLYLIMFRPPAREICLNALEDVYQTYEESRPSAGKILARWRPKKTEDQQPALANRAGPPNGAPDGASSENSSPKPEAAASTAAAS
ncbi:conserved hypothetical protein [Aspergillus terreus NIH2624]|uniref:Symplekin/Pta1 N-terminal domain-containing protein n=1 Tax=Aspergillus terreus (strain NIH 2624 / FGSC A1156) TaxID=341663 RepID=Q0D1X9_ASPTN|nr:uncharacterized protein ATEG_00055 [Aspergillus terreus NIH2624]EAU38701.1 conserved hypothetical protein [Aspergillus terreus NIH2624]